MVKSFYFLHVHVFSCLFFWTRINSFFFKVIIHNPCQYSSVEISIWRFCIMQIRKVMQLKWYKTGSAAKMLSWQQLNRCHFVLFVMNISDAKFKKQCFNISRDIRYLVFYNFSCKAHDVITFLICILQNIRHAVSLKCHFPQENWYLWVILT